MAAYRTHYTLCVVVPTFAAVVEETSMVIVLVVNGFGYPAIVVSEHTMSQVMPYYVNRSVTTLNV